MTADDQLTYLKEQVFPRLAEVGVEASVILGYIKTEDGSLKRFCFANMGNNPVFEDALRQSILFTHIWATGTTPPIMPQSQPEGE